MYSVINFHRASGAYGAYANSILTVNLPEESTRNLGSGRDCAIFSVCIPVFLCVFTGSRTELEYRNVGTVKNAAYDSLTPRRNLLIHNCGSFYSI